MPYEEMLETRLYKEWARPQRLADAICTVLDEVGRELRHVRRFPP